MILKLEGVEPCNGGTPVTYYVNSDQIIYFSETSDGMTVITTTAKFPIYVNLSSAALAKTIATLKGEVIVE